MRRDLQAAPRWQRFAAALVACASLGGCGNVPRESLRRIDLGPGPLQRLEADGVTRPGWRIGQDTAPRRVPLADVAAGRFDVYAAPEGDAAFGGGIEIALRSRGWRSWFGLGSDHRCTLRWGDPGDPEHATWERCTFDLPRALGSAELSLRRIGRTGGEILVSEPQLSGDSGDDRPNVFVLLLDTTRFDQLRPFADSAPLGDRLSELGRDSVVLRDLHSSSSWTRPAVATIFTGLRADRHRVEGRGDVMAEYLVTLPERMRDAGYVTSAWSTNPNVLTIWGMAQGFDTFVDQGSRSWATRKTDGRTVISLARAALATRGNAPGFYYLHLMDAHAPYRPSPEQREAVQGLPGLASRFPRPEAVTESPQHWSAFVDYMGELLDLDGIVGDFIDLLRQERLYESSLVLVVSDHGEEFLDHGRRDHGQSLYEEVLRVPALLKLPGNRHAGRVVESPVSLEDLLPTLLAGIGMDVPEGLDGRAIPLDDSRAVEPRPHVATLRLDGRRMAAILDPPWKLIRSEGIGQWELFHLGNDPQERHDVAGREPLLRKRLASEMERVLRGGQTGWHVLLCGKGGPSSLELLVETEAGSVQTFGFDSGEVRADDSRPGVLRVRAELTPREVERAVYGRMIREMLPEHDEIVLSPPAARTATELTVSPPPAGRLDYRLGGEDVFRSGERIRVSPTTGGAAVPEGRAVDCDSTTKPNVSVASPPGPFLRIWFVPPAESLATDRLAPELKDRLRSLGYLE